MLNKKILLTHFISIMFCFPTLHAQNIILRGLISDRQTGQGLELANITLEAISNGSSTGTTTDSNGLFQFNDVQKGHYIFNVRYIGYETYTDTLELESSGQHVVKNVEMVRADESLDELIVSDTWQDDLEPGQTRIEAEDLRRVPTPAGSGDLASYLQTQPGVVAAGDRGGQLFIRGGTPAENLVLMDGTLIYQPFHIVGFFSVFPEDVVSTVDLYAGGFGPRYNSRTSAVMDVKLRNGNLYNRSWSASLSPFVSDLFFETPVRKGKSSLLVSVRGSMIEESSKLYLVEEQPLRFNSQLIKYSNIGEGGFNCSAHAMRTYDRGKLDFDTGEVFKWRNVVVGGRCAGVSEEMDVSFVDMNVGISHFSNSVEGVGINDRNASVFRSHVDVNILHHIGNLRLDYGFFSNYRTINHDISEKFLPVQNSNTAFLSSGGYLDATIPVGEKFSVDPGFVFTSYIQKFKASLEPRLQISWQPRGRVDEEIHAAVGIYRQPLAGITDFRDAGAAFTAWMPMPDPNRRMESRHAVLGWRQPLGRFLDFSIEGYYKDIRNTPVAIWSMIAQFTTDLGYANGDVYGSDIRLNFNYRKFYWTIGYGYSETKYKTAQDHFSIWFGEPVQEYNPPHDRRHQISVQTGFEIGKFTANISWVYGSGTPFTRPLGFDSFFRFLEHLPDVVGEYGTPRVLLDKPYNSRLPDFHRLDVSLEQAFDISNTRVRIQVGAINLYDRNNLFYYDVFNRNTIYQLPVLPYVSLKLESG